ncbi:MAG: hypothetical protein LC745_01165 [Planctomycetia bacterium]|nr:hypothetical protein [Planctomycetia bacterium]
MRYQIRQGESSLWSIFTDDGDQVFADEEFRFPREALRRLRAIASAEGLAMITKERPDKSVTVEFVPHGSVPQARESYLLTLEMTPEIHNSLSQLAEDTGQNINDVIRSALGMYKLAVDAHKQGKSVGISETPVDIQTRFF